MNEKETLESYLKSIGFGAAAKDVLKTFDTLGKLPELIHGIPAQLQMEKSAFEMLSQHVSQAIKAAKYLERTLPPTQECGLDPLHITEKSWATRMTEIQAEIRIRSPLLRGGRPRNIGEEKLALGVMGALQRHGVPEKKIARITADCLVMMGISDKSIERAVNSARKVTKAGLK